MHICACNYILQQKKNQQNNGSMEILAIDQIKFTKVKKLIVVLIEIIQTKALHCCNIYVDT